MKKLIIPLIVLFVCGLCVVGAIGIAIYVSQNTKDTDSRVTEVTVTVQNVPDAQPQGIVVNPARKYIDVKPGDIFTEIIKLKYHYKDATLPSKQFDVSLSDFAVDQTSCEPTTGKDPQFSISEWVSIDYDKIDDWQKTEVEIPLKITVPANAKPGTYWFSVDTQEFFDFGEKVPTQLRQLFILVIGDDRSQSCFSYDF